MVFNRILERLKPFTCRWLREKWGVSYGTNQTRCSRKDLEKHCFLNCCMISAFLSRKHSH